MNTIGTIALFCLAIGLASAGYVPSLPTPCDYYPCYKGWCEDWTGSPVCNCFCGYRGYYCQIEDDSLKKNCNNGRCILDEYGQPKCLCNHGYTGPWCTVPPPPNPCKGYCANGECKLDSYGDPFCVCPKEFYGTKCELPVDLCDDPAIAAQCEYGTCQNAVGYYWCKCDDPNDKSDFCNGKKFGCDYNQENPCEKPNPQNKCKYYFTHVWDNCYVQCDDFGGCFDRQCGDGTEWNKETNTCDFPKH